MYFSGHTTSVASGAQVVPSAFAPEAVASRPRLIFFYSARSGRCRRVEGFLAQVLQRRHNHETFDLTRVSVEMRPDLAERFHVQALPTVLVVEQRRVQARLVTPHGCRELERFLHPWLQPRKDRNGRATRAATPSAHV